MTTQLDIGEKLAAAPDPGAEQAILDQRSELPAEMRIIPYEIRLLSDGRVLTAEDVSSEIATEVEVALFCHGEYEEREVLWRPKSDESLVKFLRDV